MPPITYTMEQLVNRVRKDNDIVKPMSHEELLAAVDTLKRLKDDLQHAFTFSLSQVVASDPENFDDPAFQEACNECNECTTMLGNVIQHYHPGVVACTLFIMDSTDVQELADMVLDYAAMTATDTIPKK